MSNKKKSEKTTIIKKTEHMESITVGYLRKILAFLPSDYEVLLKVEEKDNYTFFAYPISFGVFVSDEQKEVLLECESETPIDQDDILPEDTIYGES